MSDRLRRVLGIVYTHEHGALHSATRIYCREIGRAGFEAEVVDLSTPDGPEILKARLNSGEVEFCFGIQGVGSQLKSGEDNLWTRKRIPFLALHFDNPCYNPFNHHNLSPFVANLYHFESFLEIQQRYIGGSQVTGLLPFEVFGPDHALPAFEERPIKLLFLKAGGDVAEFTDYFTNLPPPVRDGVWYLLERTRDDPNLLLCELVENLFLQLGYDRRTHEKQFWAVVQSMDFYIRRRRAIDFVNWLKFQDGAVIVGDGWDMIDRTGARAEFRPAVNAELIVPLFEQTQFICNTNPYGRDLIHERIAIGLLYGCCVLTDTNAWWDKYFADVPALARFQWSQSLDDQLQPVITDPQAAAVASLTGHAPAARHFTGQAAHLRIVAYAEQVRTVQGS